MIVTAETSRREEALDRIDREIADEQYSRERSIARDTENGVDKDICNYFTGKKPGFFFSFPMTCLTRIIKGKRYTDEEYNALLKEHQIV